MLFTYPDMSAFEIFEVYHCRTLLQGPIDIDSVEQIYIHDIISKQRVLCFNTTTQQNSCLHTCKSNNT